MKIALVEMFVDLNGLSTQRKPIEESDGIRMAISNNAPARRADVLAALKAAKKNAADVVVFPGWTIYGMAVPKAVLNASKGLVVVLETFVRTTGSKRHARVHVIVDGTVTKSLRQRIAQGNEVLDGTALSVRARDLVDEVVGGARDITIDKVSALLLLCGETNLVGGGSKGSGSAYHRPEVTARAPTLTAATLSQRPLVLNPSHTRMRPNASREKRRWLSQKGTLVTTANTRSAYWGWRWDKSAQEYLPARKHASLTAAAAYRYQNDLQCQAGALAGSPSVRIAYVDVP